ncbi:unnamed protein product [Adineta ricciae]|uniref:Kinesin light chain n=1 Tax=Adineta ricciae TaxID=249248 RepID=A0A813W7D6_ADIRI|nr:unnamed protein product [Adineta ricciae]CAF1383299.1 unnamed protein product [Adineta ricciae]
MSATKSRSASTGRIVQHVLLVWLADNIDEDNNECQRTIAKLQSSIGNVNAFISVDVCVRFIENVHDERICMITSSEFGEKVVPRIHHLPQVDSIFIFPADRKRHLMWTNEWSKIKGTFTCITPICDAIKQVANQCEHNSLSISFLNADTITVEKKLDELDCSFMYTQIIKEILLKISFEQEHFEQFIDYCRKQFAANKYELNNIEKFHQEYHDHTPIWWYTKESFLYPMLNRALRIMDITVVINIGFYIVDLHRQIQQLHRKQFNQHDSCGQLRLYRGQGLSKADFQQLTNTQGGLIAFNSFLSCSERRDISLNYAYQCLSNSDMIGILFVMNVDSNQSTTPFAAVENMGCFQTESEILFSMHSVFRIRDLRSIDENNRLYEVELILTSDNDRDLRILTERIQEDSDGRSGWFQLSVVLSKMGQFNKAEDVCQVLLERSTTDEEKGPIYHQLGCIKDQQGRYLKAIKFYEKALEIDQKMFPSNHLSFAASYNNIGEVYRKMTAYSDALCWYDESLNIQEQSLPSDHPDLASSYNNIGIICGEMGDYSKALIYHEKALQIRQKSLPSAHPDLGGSYDNIGSIYLKMGNYTKALPYYEKSLKIRRKSLPPDHPDLAMSYNNIGSLYGQMGEYEIALPYFEKDLQISTHVLPPNHPDLGISYKNMGMIYERMGDHSKAQEYYERAVNIIDQSLPACAGV